MIDRLRFGPPRVGVIVDGGAISRPAVSQHLRVLTDAGLMTVIPSIAPEGVDQLRRYLDTLWGDAFARVATEKAKENNYE